MEIENEEEDWREEYFLSWYLISHCQSAVNKFLEDILENEKEVNNG